MAKFDLSQRFTGAMGEHLRIHIPINNGSIYAQGFIELDSKFPVFRNGLDTHPFRV